MIKKENFPLKSNRIDMFTPETLSRAKNILVVSSPEPSPYQSLIDNRNKDTRIMEKLVLEDKIFKNGFSLEIDVQRYLKDAKYSSKIYRKISLQVPKSHRCIYKYTLPQDVSFNIFKEFNNFKDYLLSEFKKKKGKEGTESYLTPRYYEEQTPELFKQGQRELYWGKTAKNTNKRTFQHITGLTSTKKGSAVHSGSSLRLGQWYKGLITLTIYNFGPEISISGLSEVESYCHKNFRPLIGKRE